MPETPERSTTRNYRSALRTEQAAATRRRVLESAAACFIENGYGGTSLAAIAEHAGVSPETVKANGPKRDLLLGAFEQAFAGVEGPEPISGTEAGEHILEASDAEAFLLAGAAFVAEANARTSVLWTEFLAAANTDPGIAEALDELLERRRRDYRALAQELIERGVAPRSGDVGEIAAELSFLWSPESHQQLVLQGGWGLQRYRDWLAEAVRRQLA